MSKSLNENSALTKKQILVRLAAALATITGSVEFIFAISRIRFHTPLFVFSLMILALAIICGGLLIYIENLTVGGVLVIAFSLGYNFIATEEWRYGFSVLYGILLAGGLLSGVVSVLLGLFEYAERRKALTNTSK